MDIPVLLFSIAAAAIAWILIDVVARLQKPRRPAPSKHPTPGVPAPPERASRSRPTLEEQVAALRDAGMPLNPYVTIDDLLHSWPREEYEDGSYHCLIFMYGSEIEREPWGRHISAYAWNFDTECIEGPGSYVRIVQELARIAGATTLITNVTDNIDMSAPTATLSYNVRGVPRTLTLRIDNDWADPEAAASVMQDIEKAVDDGRRFRGADNGQSTIWFFINDETADKVNAITGNLLAQRASRGD